VAKRFRAYARKVFGLDQRVKRDLHDQRLEPRLSLPAIWMTALLMFFFRSPSLNGVDKDLKRRHACGTGKRPAGAPSERTIRRVFEWLSLMEMRAMVKAMVRVLKDNKVALTLAHTHGLVALAFDGHEFFASPVRGCKQCLERDVHTRDPKTGEKHTHKEYYHRVAVCFVVDCLIPILLDVEPVLPGEAEINAARRLLERVLKDHPRLFDVATCDALYAEKEFLQIIRRANKHFVVVLKDERREVYDEALRLRRHIKPDSWFEDGRRCTVWDIGDLHSWWKGPKVPLRVIWSEETYRQPKKGRRRGQTVSVTSTWVWLTIWHFGHKRWHIENRCFHDGVRHWGFDHCFHHHPNAICAFLFTLSIAMILVHTFLKRNLKEPVRKLFTAVALRLQVFRDLGTLMSWSDWVHAGFMNDS